MEMIEARLAECRCVLFTNLSAYFNGNHSSFGFVKKKILPRANGELLEDEPFAAVPRWYFRHRKYVRVFSRWSCQRPNYFSVSLLTPSHPSIPHRPLESAQAKLRADARYEALNLVRMRSRLTWKNSKT